MEHFMIDSCGVKRAAIYVDCYHCNNKFLKKKKDINRSKKHFCNRECSRNFISKSNTMIICAWCKKEKKRKLSSLNRSASGLFFCSRLCKNTAQSINGLPGITPPHYGKTLKNKTKQCLVCGKTVKYSVKHCADCQKVKSFDVYIKRWKLGLETGNRSNNESLSQNVRRYIFEKYKSKCIRCGWCEINPKSKKIPLTINHIDGDSSNSHEDNLELICPNCHSLTPNYGSLNKGNGRKSRRKLP